MRLTTACSSDFEQLSDDDRTTIATLQSTNSQLAECQQQLADEKNTCAQLQARTTQNRQRTSLSSSPQEPRFRWPWRQTEAEMCRVCRCGSARRSESGIAAA